jgi:hypothetical protein
VLIPKRIINKRTDHEGLTDLQWVHEIRGNLLTQAFFEYFIWDIL